MRRARPVLLAWGAVVLLTSLPYVVATLHPPPGQAFLGFFFFVDDHYLYLSYARQTQDGAFLFKNALAGVPHPAGLVNLEWWSVGRLSALLGDRPFLAYRVFGALAALLLLAVLDAWLRRGGLPERSRLPALLLLAFGGGCGGLLLSLGLLPPQRCLDLATGLFPFVGLLANAHFTGASALLLASLWFLAQPGPGAQALGVLLGCALGVVRPYDFVLLPLLRLGTLAFTEAPGAALRKALPLAGLAPVVALDYWTFRVNPGFAYYSTAPYLFPRAGDLALALLPAAALALFGVRAPAADARPRQARALFLSWCGLGVAIAILRPVPYSLQFLVGLGIPLLALAALGLARRRPAALWIAAGLLSTTAAVALRLVLAPLPYWFTAEERLEAARALRPLCEPGDRVFAPADVGLFVGGLTACTPYVSHVSHPEYASRRAVVAAFYGKATPAEREAELRRVCPRYLLLPGEPGERPTAWLGPDALYERAAVAGRPPHAITLYRRRAEAACPSSEAGLLSVPPHP
jgi:hypothetical protein